MSLFIVPATRENIEKTIINAVPIEVVKKFLNGRTITELNNAIAPKKSFHCWAVTETLRRRVFEPMNVGDTVLLTETGTGTFNYKAKVTFKFESEKLGEHLWEYVPNKPWKLIYVLDDIEEININKKKLVTSIGYDANDAVAGARMVRKNLFDRVVGKHGSIEAFLESHQNVEASYGSIWSATEVKHAVDEYFEMLSNELRGESFNKAAHLRRLLPTLRGRTKGSIEYKFENISAILIQKGLPYIDGYKPAGNFQRILVDATDNYIEKHPSFFELLNISITSVPLVKVGDANFENDIDEPPAKSQNQPDSLKQKRKYQGRKFDYSKKESENKELGKRGEEYVVAVERSRLIKAGRPDLAKQVERVSQTRGDGLGHDVASFEVDGSERCIEVKTTKYGKEIPFYISANELQFSIDHCTKCYLYRVFNFAKTPKFFVLKGSLEEQCNLSPQIYQASF